MADFAPPPAGPADDAPPPAPGVTEDRPTDDRGAHRGAHPAEPRRWRTARLWAAAAGLVTIAAVGVLAVAMVRGVGDDELGEIASGIEEVPPFTLPVLLVPPAADTNGASGTSGTNDRDGTDGTDAGTGSPGAGSAGTEDTDGTEDADTEDTDADTDFLGAPYAIVQHGDQPLFLYFWASWCYPCEQEAPLIQRLWEEEYRDRGVAFVGINILDDAAAAQAFARRHGLTFPLLYDRDGDAYLEFGVNGVPDAYFIEPGLRVQRRFIGPLHEAEFRSMLDRLVGGSS